ncbi:MAG: histidinol-phosphate transaminase [Rubricella sp.]
MSQKIAPQPGILDIAPYVPGESRIAGANRVLKLSSNENPLGPSPKAIEAYRAAADTLALYPDADHAGLRHAIAEVHGIDPARVVCGAGSDEILTFLAQAYAGPGDEVIHTEHGFSMYPIVAMAAGARPVSVPERERTADVDAILAVATERTRLVYLANPNNPTGTILPGSEIERLADGLPEGCILVLDGAYAEFVTDPDYDAGLALIESRANVVMTRTFSKIYGLGGLRIGWGYGPAEIMGVLNRIRGPFNLSGPALAAAEAAVLDTDYTAHCIAVNARWRAWMLTELRAMGLPCDDAHANFVLPRFGSAERADAADAYLKSRGILVRQVAGYGLPEALRITVGDEAGSRQVIAALRDFVEAS